MTPTQAQEVRVSLAELCTPFNFLARPSWKALVKLAALKHGVGRKDILSRDRSFKVAMARHSAMRLLDAHCDLSPAAIGKLMGRDRTTVLYAIGRRTTRPCGGTRNAH